ncbi:MAG: hypothetical protein NXI09_15535 [Bacteroidetes bacterium]|nr:hypothetical protein [Bacteroidota bacterium]
MTQVSSVGVVKICRELGYKNVSGEALTELDLLTSLRQTILLNWKKRGFMIKLVYGGKPPKSERTPRKRKKHNVLEKRKKATSSGSYASSNAFGQNVSGRISIISTRMKKTMK